MIFQKTALLLALCILFSACGSPAPAQAPSSDIRDLSFDEILARAQEREQQEVIASQAQMDPAAFAVIGVYYSVSEGVAQDNLPKLTLSEDFTAVFHANLLSAMGDISGMWSYDNGSVIFEVKSVEFSGFLGQDVERMDFEVQEDGSLLLTHIMPSTPIGMTVEKDVFQRQS